MSRISNLKHSIHTATAAVLLLGLLSPANANQPDAVTAEQCDCRSCRCQGGCKEPVARTDLAPALACSGRPSATTPS